MYEIGSKVYKITDSNKIGTIKNFINTLNGIRYQVLFENGEIIYLSEDILAPYEEINTPLESFINRQFGSIEDYRRILSYQRLNGELTNLFYSMTNNMTDYLPHQFLPVTKFLQSPEERILIADEVGLGKTIEAIYIWKELEARRNAKRLLVVCPAALREKWQRDMRNLFGINAEIVNAKNLLERFKLIEKNRYREQFVYICSIESIRTKNTEFQNNVCVLNKEFEDFAANYSEYAFNLTIIDEAHYLRNRETANFKTGERLRDISEAMILLSATPIQTTSSNLYSLMNLLSPERFEDEHTFNYMLDKDSGLIQLANCLQRPSSEQKDFMKIIMDKYPINAITEKYEYDNDLVDEIINNIDDIFASPEKRMAYANNLRNQVFYYSLFNRTRRRFVFDNTAKRKPNAVKFNLTPFEMSIYTRVTKMIQEMALGQTEIITFALIARQRQMASCLPAAFKEWKTKIQNAIGFNEEDNENEYTEFNETLEDDEPAENKSSNNNFEEIKRFYSSINKHFSDINYEELKRCDSKYKEFLHSIKTLLQQNKEEKIIVFSFYRGTNAYLEERLKEDGINVVAIKGGMGPLKDEILERFRTDNRINVLISSEVGSEGLDLQFCSVEYNYDLPWNPMRLEQRIGRIDRIGQKAEVLRIFNLCCTNTIEDKILTKLYERVKIFENSIGDMEDIVGKPIQELARELFNPKLTDEDKEEKAKQKIQVLINQRYMNNKLEDEFVVLDAYRDLVINSIDRAKNNKRCIDENEIIFIINDFFKNYFPGTAFYEMKENPGYYKIGLSNEAIIAFREFRINEHLQKTTSIDSAPSGYLTITFTKKHTKKLRCEVIDLDHPIFDWIKFVINKEPLRVTGCSAITMLENKMISKGNYVYYIQKWKKDGVEKSTELKYFLMNVNNNTFINPDKSEQILNTLITEGKSLINPIIKMDNFEPYYNAINKIINYAFDAADSFVDDYKKKNKFIYNQQVEFINFTADKKIETIENIIDKLRFENKNVGVIHMNEKRIAKINNERKIKLQELEKLQIIEPEISDLAMGVLVVE